MNKPAHAPLNQFPIVNDELVIGGLPLPQLVEQVGRTPFYAYAQDAIRQRIEQLRTLLPEDLRLHYAVKANPYPPLVQLMADLADGLDIASSGELTVALNTAIDPVNISFAGPGKRNEELRLAIQAGLTINIESPNELQRIVSIGESLSRQPRIAVRINPDFELKSSGMKMGGGSSPFGIDAELVPQVLQQIKEQDVHLRGFHIFNGSQNLNAQNLIEAQNATFELAYNLVAQASIELETLNIGGGFGIPYFPGEERLNIAAVAENLHQQTEHCVEHLGKDTEVIVELGRYLVGEAGVYVCRVIDKKISRGKTYLVTDGGMHHHLAASGNFGQIIRKNYPVVNGTSVLNGKRETVNVVGPLCTPLDILASNMEMGAASPGDIIVVLQSGAYGYSASPLKFLSHPPPAEILV